MDLGWLKKRVKDVVEQHGGLQPAGRALKIDHAYLSRLLRGEKTNPSAKVLRKLKLVRVVTFVGEKPQ